VSCPPATSSFRHDGMEGMGMKRKWLSRRALVAGQKEEAAWTDAAGTRHTVTLEASVIGYTVRHALDLRGGSSVLGEASHGSLLGARDAFTREVER
jgi:hypothetical protein